MADTEKLKFRFHRGGLDESMATVVDFASLAELVSIINDAGFEPGKLAVKPYGPEDRIGWPDQHIVTVDGHAVGFTSGALR